MRKTGPDELQLTEAMLRNIMLSGVSAPSNTALPKCTKMQRYQLKHAFEPLARNPDIDYLAVRHSAYHSEKIVNFTSNDQQMNASLQELARAKVLQQPQGVTPTAVIVGEHNFATLLYALNYHAQAVVFVDIDPLILEHNMFMVKLIRESRNHEEYVQRYLGAENPLFREKVTMTPIVAGNMYQQTELVQEAIGYPVDDAILSQVMMRKVQTDFGTDYFMINSHSFERCKHAAHRMHFSVAQLDLFSLEQGDKLAAALKQANAKVTVLGLTNLALIDGEKSLFSSDKIWRSRRLLEQNLCKLVQPDAPIHFLFSEYAHGERAILESKFCTSLEDYLASTNKHVLLMNFGKVSAKFKLGAAGTDYNLIFRTVMAKGDQQDVLVMIQFYKVFMPLLKQTNYVQTEQHRGGTMLIDINAAGPKSGRTALHQAVLHKNAFAVRCLLALDDVDVTIRDTLQGKTAYEYACDNSDNELIDMLYAHAEEKPGNKK